MSIDRGQVLRVIEEADHPLGVRELLSRLALNPGQQTDLKRVLRELVRGGAIEKEGKRYRPHGVPAAAQREAQTGRFGGDRGGPGRAGAEGDRGGRFGAGQSGRSAEDTRGGESGGPGGRFGGESGGRAGRFGGQAVGPGQRSGGESGGRGERGSRFGGESGGPGQRGGGAAGSPGQRGGRFGGESGGRSERGGRFGGESGGRGERGGRFGGESGGRGERGGRFGGARGGGFAPGAPGGRGGRGGHDVPRSPEEREQYLESLRALDDTVEGILHVHRDGFGFVHPLKDTADENIFLPPDQASRAMDGDRVIVQVVEGRGGRTAGVLLEVVERVRERAIGVYRLEGRQAWVEPNDTSLRGNINVPPTQLARPGDLVKVVLGIGAAVLDPGVQLFGEIIGSVGKPGEPSGEVLSVAYSQGFSDEFPEAVMAEADAYKVEVSAEEAAGEGRHDLRSLQLITIDGEDARDFDDAVYCEEVSGGWRLVVAIADVSHYVREGTALDAEALHRGTSVYLPDRVLPMLPERLSNGICSLRPDEDRLCMVADMKFDARAELKSYELYPGVMRSAARCTYNEVQDVLDGKDVPHRNFLEPHFRRLMALARVLNGMRKARGAIDFDLPEFKVVLDDQGQPVKLDKRERKDSHRLVEECMLAANEAVAKFFQDRELPSVYRFHGEPDTEKLEAFAQLARAHGFTLPPAENIESRDLNRLLEELEGHPESRALNHLLLRAMMQAVYSAENIGHYGLGATHYLHFTSPIRRYPDLLVHRLLKAHWRRGERIPPKHERDKEEAHLEELAVQSSERERAAVAVEREVVAYYQTLLMKDRVGEEFEATVASITDFGFFVELIELHVEGLVKGEALGPSFDLDAEQHALIWPNGRRVKVGDKLTARLISANVERRQLEFEPVAFEGEEPLPSARRGAYEEEEAPRRRGPRQPSWQPRGPAAQREATPRGRPHREPPGRPTPPHPGAEPEERRHPSPAAPAAGTWAPPHLESEPESESRGGSPHPGFDRLRALAAQKGGGKGGFKDRGGGKQTGGGRGSGGRGHGGRDGGRGQEAHEPERDKFGNPRKRRDETPHRGQGGRAGGGRGGGRGGGTGGGATGGGKRGGKSGGRGRR